MGDFRLGRWLLQGAQEVGVTGAVDIILLASIVYLALAWLRRTRTTAAFRGVVVLAGAYLAARQLNLALTAWALEAFFLALLVAAIVIFRDELRHAVEQLASLRGRLSRAGRRAPSTHEEMGTSLARTLEELAAARVGALVVIEGKMSLDGHLDGGVRLDGIASGALLHSLFDPHSVGHDGAVLIRAGRIDRFATHLPLSTNFEELGQRGTRHAAALGLAERTDAMCLVVSEERGEISVARDGSLRRASGAELATAIRGFLGPLPRTKRRWQGWARESPAIFAAVGIALALWFVLVHGATVTQRTFSIPVQYAELDPDKRVAAVHPAKVTLTFTGTRRDFYFVSGATVKLVVPLGDAKLGSKVVAISPYDVSFPASLSLKTIEPSHVVLQIAPVASAAAGK